jgi:hypothetical protein
MATVDGMDSEQQDDLAVENLVWAANQVEAVGAVVLLEALSCARELIRIGFIGRGIMGCPDRPVAFG